MNKETLKALEGSIEKWEKIVAGKELDLGWQNCPLCRRFLACIGGCPVDIATRGAGCTRTPWTDWAIHHEVAHKDKKTMRVFKNCPECKELAQAELDFLKSLLPKEKTYE